MAATATTSFCYSASSVIRRTSPTPPPFLSLLPWLTRTRNGPKLHIVAGTSGPDLFGDFGGRDPFPEEIASNFGEKVLGFMSTEHKILIPNASALCLSQLSCSPNYPPLSHDEAKQLLFKVVGWRLFEDKDSEGGKTVLKLLCLWKLRRRLVRQTWESTIGFEMGKPIPTVWLPKITPPNRLPKPVSSGAELIGRIAKVAEEAGHYPVLHLEKSNNQVRAELWTEDVGGLSLNDFIVAAKIDGIKTSDLSPRKRVWA